MKQPCLFKGDLGGSASLKYNMKKFSVILLGKRENVWNKIAVYHALLAKLSFAL
jgi:hypothetical protein